MKNRMKKEKKLVCYFILPKSYQRAQCAHPSARQLLQQDQLWAEYATAKAVGRVKVKPTWNNLFMTQQILLARVGVSSSSLFAGHRTKGSVADVHIPDIPSQPARSGLSERCSDSKDRRCLLGQHDPDTFPGIQMWQWRWEEPHISMGELQRHLNLMPVPSLVPDKPCLCMEGLQSQRMMPLSVTFMLHNLHHPWLMFLYTSSLCTTQCFFLRTQLPFSWQLSATGHSNLISCWESEAEWSSFSCPCSLQLSVTNTINSSTSPFAGRVLVQVLHSPFQSLPCTLALVMSSLTFYFMDDLDSLSKAFKEEDRF